MPFWLLLATLHTDRIQQDGGDTMDRFICIAAGFIKTADNVPKGLADIVDHVAFGSFTENRRDGNKEPRYHYDEVTRTSRNARGLDNQGLTAFTSHDLPKLTYIVDAGAKIRISLAPTAPHEVFRMVTHLNATPLVTALGCEIEVNAACPNHWSKDGALHDVVAKDPDALEKLMCEAAHFHGKKSIKIAPCMAYEELEYCIDLANAYNYDSIVSGNTKRVPGYVDNKKVLSVEYGGMGGASLFDDALRQVNTLNEILSQRETRNGPKIIACGGIMEASNAISMLMVGAERVQVATYFAQFGIRGVTDLVANLADITELS